MTKEEANKYFLEEELNIKGDNKGHEDALANINKLDEPAEGTNWMKIAKAEGMYAMLFPHEVGEAEEDEIKEPELEDPAVDTGLPKGDDETQD